MTPYQVFEVDRSLAKNLEQLGTKRKFWFPRNEDQPDWLFKAEERNTGEDWAEKIACELCVKLGIPHVHYELAMEIPSNTPGVICPNVAAPPRTLVLGNQLLGEKNATYPMDDERKYGVRQHTIGAVAEAVKKLELPPTPFCDNLPNGVQTALDVFAGYLMLDALIANQDRHHQNWGSIRENYEMLAPTFDHGAALARNEPETKRKLRLSGHDPQYSVENFAARARSALYASDADARTLSTMEAFQAFSEVCPAASQAWRNRLLLLNRSDFEGIVGRIPAARISDLAREFTVQLLLVNQKRILESNPNP